MGIVNVTPDSFSDGGRFQRPDAAVEHALALVEQGADLLDIGGESTRPGAEAVALDEELERVIPVIEALSRATGTPISVDTSKAEVMVAAAAAGASMINDVNALRGDGALEATAGLTLPVCLMHMQGQPRTMQAAPRYTDVVLDVSEFLRSRIADCRDAGIDEERLIIDPGYGFGKTLEHNLTLLRRQNELLSIGPPLLIGISRKSMLGALTGRDSAADRLSASLAAAVIAAERGASILRVHDVAETVDALRIFEAARAQGTLQ
ncbi:MAG: dihydropteroate synthase [Wenzhouxiangella sp.]|nr:dihydropteroate synthase [Wenzhouxiangella sp.]